VPEHDYPLVLGPADGDGGVGGGGRRRCGLNFQQCSPEVAVDRLEAGRTIAHGLLDKALK